MTDIAKLESLLSRYGQSHLLQFWGSLSQADREELVEDIRSFDFNEVSEYFKRANDPFNNDQGKLDDRLRPIPSGLYGSVSRTPADVLTAYEDEGLRSIADNEVGVLLMAGGQGTRLGSINPKGMYDVGLPSHKTLYQIQAERIRRLTDIASAKYGKACVITWFIMTSEHTMGPTIDFFIKHNYFGLNRNNVVLFEQGLLPCFSFDGRIIMEKPHRIAKAPDGNGGLYRALRDQKILDIIEERGIKYLHAHSVDNILVKVADPVFIGYCIKKGASCGAKVVEKAFPAEPLGVVCNIDGKYQVVEYSEITLKTAEMRNNDGRLTFSAGNICNHFFTASFLREIADKHEHELKLHVAKKKIAFINSDGKQRLPEKPNGIKIEKFVFDVFQFADNLVVWEVNREEEFSALKNSDSADKDNPTTARKDLFDLHRRYIEAAGGIVEGSSPVCEISPLLSYAGEAIKPLVQGRTLHPPVLLAAPSEVCNKI